jgi:hypothetical protein
MGSSGSAMVDEYQPRYRGFHREATPDALVDYSFALLAMLVIVARTCSGSDAHAVTSAVSRGSSDARSAKALGKLESEIDFAPDLLGEILMPSPDCRSGGCGFEPRRPR